MSGAIRDAPQERWQLGQVNPSGRDDELLANLQG